MSRYDDIIDLPHHVSRTRPQMSLHDRAAQFAPFAALVGYDDTVAETTRVTEEKPELDEQQQRELNERLTCLAERILDQPLIHIRYFVPDAIKSGGSILELSGKLRKITPSARTITMSDGITIPLDNILEIRE